MMKVLIKREMKMNSSSLLIWLGAISLFVLLAMVKSTGFIASENNASYILATSFPPIMRAMYGLDGLDITTFEGYFGVITMFLMIILSAFSITNCFKLYVLEEEDKTYEYIYAKPVDRNVIVGSKIITNLLLSIILNVSVFVLTLCIISPMFENSFRFYGYVLQNYINIFCVQLFFIGISSIIIAFFTHVRGKTKYALMIVLILYIFMVAAELNYKLEPLAKLSPFWVFSSERILNQTISFNTHLIPFAIYILGIGILLFIKPNDEIPLS